MKKYDVVWAAGLFDGEGCITIEIVKHYKKPGARDSFVLCASVSMTHKEAIEKLKNIFGKGSVSTRPPKKPRIEQWRWVVQQHHAKVVLKKMLPFLLVKKQEALLGLEFLEKTVRNKKTRVTDEEFLIRKQFYDKMKSLKSRWKEEESAVLI